MISILIPTYQYNIFPLVDSLYKQLQVCGVDYEIRVYDDGSPFPELQNGKIISFKNTIYRKFEKNIGRTGIRSIMARDAKFDWLLFLDADVMPKHSNFIEDYIKAIASENCDVIFGGISYSEEVPEPDKKLRWVYGKAREAKPVEIRKKDPYFIISQNLCIQKRMFVQANTLMDNYYGLDNFFSNQLKRLDAQVLHIDNPVIHYGLEENSKFINKALKAVETTVILEKKGLMDPDLRPIQKSYLKLNRLKMLTVFSFIVSQFKGKMEQNFCSEHPNLFWFDLYRLHYYIQLKKKHNA